MGYSRETGLQSDAVKSTLLNHTEKRVKIKHFIGGRGPYTIDPKGGYNRGTDKLKLLENYMQRAIKLMGNYIIGEPSPEDKGYR